MNEPCSSTPSSLPSVTLLARLARYCRGRREATSFRDRRRCPRRCFSPSRGCASGLSAERARGGVLTKGAEREGKRDGGEVRRLEALCDADGFCVRTRLRRVQVLLG